MYTRLLFSSNIFTESIVISPEQWIRYVTHFKYFYRVNSDLFWTMYTRLLLSTNIFTESIVISPEQWIRCLTQFKYFYRVISDIHCTILLSSFLLSFKNPFRFCKPFTKNSSLNHALFTIFVFVYMSWMWTKTLMNFC